MKVRYPQRCGLRFLFVIKWREWSCIYVVLGEAADVVLIQIFRF